MRILGILFLLTAFSTGVFALDIDTDIGISNVDVIEIVFSSYNQCYTDSMNALNSGYKVYSQNGNPVNYYTDPVNNIISIEQFCSTECKGFNTQKLGAVFRQ